MAARGRIVLIATVAALVSTVLPAGGSVRATQPERVAAAASGGPIWTAATDGGVFALGAPFLGSLGGRALNAPVIAVAATPTGHGYWLAATDGGVFSFGDAHFYGSTGAMHLNRPVVGFAATPTGHGYWLVAADGGVFSFGDAHFFGSTGAIRLNQPVAAMARTPSGRGYWLVARDGGVFSFGDAVFHGRPPAAASGEPIATITASRSGRGYWVLARDGAVFAFGDASFHGSAAGGLAPHVGIVPTSSGAGYWIVSSDDAIQSFGDAAHVAAPVALARPVVGIATPWASSSGYALVLLEGGARAPVPTVGWPGPGEVALTFDDGPSAYTASVLATLAAHGVPATFFDVGYEVVLRPDLARAEVQAGNPVGDHTWNHADLTKLTPAAIDQELESGADAIRTATGVAPRCFRPPYDATNATVAAEGAKLGLAQVLYNVAPGDYLRPGADVIASRVLASATGRGLVVLLHDGGGDRSQTVAALPTIIDGLRARGYRFVRLCG